MSKPTLPIPVAHLPEPAGSHSSGEGAQTALAALIRKRRMGENHVADEPSESPPKHKPLPGA
jgi:hypothetical protein